ncbi:MAG: OB-fold nucleic acid binding domain-containing protein, partial [Segetibacter sp.]
MQAAPTKHTDKEKLTWERELLGLYLSAHPLDQYRQYLEEQTAGLGEVSLERDDEIITVGGIISSLRVITTKSGQAMAFLKLEDTVCEREIIIFPRQYEALKSVLIQDAIIRVKGKISARGRDGSLQDDVKLNAEEIVIVSDQDIANYQSTGQPYQETPQKKPPKKSSSPVKKADQKKSAPPTIYQPKTLYIHVKDTNDQERLLGMKKELSLCPGDASVVLVLG